MMQMGYLRVPLMLTYVSMYTESAFYTYGAGCISVDTEIAI
jgi:hypothetical protein